jgi:hypothetical protein
MTEISKREELLQAAAVGISLVATGLEKLSEFTQHASAALERVAESLEQQPAEEEEGEELPDEPAPASPASSDPTIPYVAQSQPRAPWDQSPPV